MIDGGKKNIAGVLVNAIDYEAAVAKIIEAAKAKQPMAVSALAVHGVMTGVQEPVHRYRLNHFDLICPDGQPVRWAMNLMYKTKLKDRVYGPTLTLLVCERAAAEGLPIYLYGSKPEVLEALSGKLRDRYPSLIIAGSQPSRFRKVSPEEKLEIAKEIRDSGAAITLVGLGCPRQEVWAYEYRDELPMPLLAVGAAFDFHAGLLPQAPKKLQDLGLEWFYRLVQEPKRLWKRYLFLNPYYVGLITLQMLKLRQFDPTKVPQPQQEILYG
ncbi:MAG: WecB/TagA/CpsF family glycosyltransferase [Cyanobacteriota bacterium]|nr:WecB/TagA/CpsF family glycosyltransferase [Cyanobacteriota bacterium]